MQEKRKRAFFYYRNGKCNTQVVERGTIGSWSTKIAKYGLDDPACRFQHLHLNWL